METKEKPLIQAKKIEVEYEGVKVFSDLSFEIFDGDFVCIVGPNGAGKSTLIKALLGQIHLKSGEIKFRNLRRKFIGYMPQESKVEKDFPASVEEIVRSGTLNWLGFRAFYGQKEEEITKRSLGLLGISHLGARYFAELSGGQRQKVLLARSLSATTRLLILDEPSNNLDYKSKNELYENLKTLNKQGITILMVTHDLDHKNLIGEKILALAGEKYFFGSTSEYVEEIHHV